MSELNTLPGGYQVWSINNQLHVVYEVPGTGIPIAWRISGDPVGVLGENPTVRHTMGPKEAAGRGVIVMGLTTDLVNTDEDPWEAFVFSIEERSRTEPWLKDPQVMAQAAEAYLEGRELTINDLRETEWFNSRTQAEMDWALTLAQSSPEEVQRLRDDKKIEVRNRLRQLGVSSPSDELVSFLSDRWLTGTWSEAYATEQMLALADPYLGIDLDPELSRLASGVESTANDTTALREQVKEWLGPFGANFSDKQYEEWAGLLRNDAQGQAKFEDMMRGHRMALLPEYANPDLKWSDIARPWQAFAESQWGEPVDEADPALMTLIRINDANQGGAYLRKTGFERGVGGATRDVAQALLRASGGQVRRAI